MEYFLLKQSKEIVNPIRLLNIDSNKYTARMSHEDFRELDKVHVAYIQYDRMQEMPDILTSPTFMVSDEIRKVMHMYDENISFKAVQVFPDEKDKIKEASKVYWVYDCVMENCMHPDTVELPNGAIEELILDKRKVRGRDIFRLNGTVQNKTIVSLAVAESILRRNPYGIDFERVSIR